MSFRHGQLPELFAAARPGPRAQPKKGYTHEQIGRCANATAFISGEDFSQASRAGHSLSVTAVREVLAVEGFAPLPRRLYRATPP